MPLRAVIFDMDGTIADTVSLVCRSISATLRRFAGRAYSEEEIMAMFGPPDDEIIRRGVPGSVYEKALAEYYRLYAEAHQREIRDAADVAGILRQCKAWGLKIGVFTGKGRVTSTITMTQLGFMPLTDVFLTGDEVAEPKPSPAGILQAVAAMGVKLCETAYAGDVDADLAAAAAAGAASILVTWYEHGRGLEARLKEKAGTVCRTAAEFLAFVERELN